MTRTYKGRTPARRYSWQALIEAMGCGEPEAMRRLGLNDGTRSRDVRDWRERGMTERAAERWAVEAGLHPFTVWPELADHRIESVRVECAARTCTVRFVPKRKGHRFCSDRCRRHTGQARRMRKLYATDPEHAARERARRMEYRRLYREYENAQARRYYRRNAERIRAARRERYYRSQRAV